MNLKVTECVFKDRSSTGSLDVSGMVYAEGYMTCRYYDYKVLVNLDK